MISGLSRRPGAGGSPAAHAVGRNAGGLDGQNTLIVNVDGCEVEVTADEDVTVLEPLLMRLLAAAAQLRRGGSAPVGFVHTERNMGQTEWGQDPGDALTDTPGAPMSHNAALTHIGRREPGESFTDSTGYAPRLG